MRLRQTSRMGSVATSDCVYTCLVSNCIFNKGGVCLSACKDAHMVTCDMIPLWADTPLPSACRDTHPPAQCMLGGTPPPRPVYARTKMATAADNTHPTGMHTCIYHPFGNHLILLQNRRSYKIFNSFFIYNCVDNL